MSARILAATEFASIKHRNQRRKDADRTPYINHPIEVACILSRAGVTDEATLMGALLHDTIEDTDTTVEELAAEFGAEVTQIVIDCSDDKSLNKVQRKKAQIDHAADVCEKAKLVKLADKLSNIRGLNHNPPATWSEERVHGYAFWCYAACRQLWGANEYLRDKLADEFSMFGICCDSAELEEEELQVRLGYYYDMLSDAADAAAERAISVASAATAPASASSTSILKQAESASEGKD